MTESEWQCPACGCKTQPARCDEQVKRCDGSTTFRPGPYVRCVDCKSEWYRPSPIRAGDDAERLMKLVNEQANDESLWFIPVYATEASLQRALRDLHAAIESKTPDECAIAALAPEG